MPKLFNFLSYFNAKKLTIIKLLQKIYLKFNFKVPERSPAKRDEAKGSYNFEHPALSESAG